MSGIVSLGRSCEKCGIDEWIMVDHKNTYLEICNKCGFMIEHNKQDYVSKFECPDCGSLSGTLEENDFKLGVRCNNCGKLHIMLEKHTTINNRNSSPKPTVNANVPKCPKCGSTAITAGQRGYSFLTGFIGSSKTVNRCANCGYKWKP